MSKTSVNLCYGLATLNWGRGGSSYVMGSQHCIGEEGNQAMLWARNIVLGERGIKLCYGFATLYWGEKADQAMLWVRNTVLGGEGEFLKTFLKFP